MSKSEIKKWHYNFDTQWKIVTKNTSFRFFPKTVLLPVLTGSFLWIYINHEKKQGYKTARELKNVKNENYDKGVQDGITGDKIEPTIFWGQYYSI